MFAGPSTQGGEGEAWLARLHHPTGPLADTGGGTEDHERRGAAVLGTEGHHVVGPRLRLVRVDADLHLEQQDEDRHVIAEQDDDVDAPLGGQELADLPRTDIARRERREGEGAGMADGLDRDGGIAAEKLDELFVQERGHDAGGVSKGCAR